MRKQVKEETLDLVGIVEAMPQPKREEVQQAIKAKITELMLDGFKPKKPYYNRECY